jgi:hypothetical protein
VSGPQLKHVKKKKKKKKNLGLTLSGKSFIMMLKTAPHAATSAMPPKNLKAISF